VVAALVEAAHALPAEAWRGRRATLGFELGRAGTYRLVMDNGRVSLDSQGADADCVITTDETTLSELLRGERSPTTTLLSGRAAVRGDVDLVLRLMTFLSRVGAAPD
jgi:putative sterol carrier protein